MKVYIYKNNLCDPVRKIGNCRQFALGKDVDEYVSFFVSSIDPKHITNWRVFITNDDVEFTEVDHFVLFNEPLTSSASPGRIQEIDVYGLAMEVNELVQAKEKRRSEAKRRMDKALEGKCDATVQVV